MTHPLHRRTGLQPSPERGSALVLAAMLIFVLSILVVSMGNGLTNTINANSRIAGESELTYAAIGFANLVMADLTRGQLSDEILRYHMEAGSAEYEVAADWDGRRGPRIFVTFRVEDRQDDATLDAKERRIITRAVRRYGSLEQSLDVSVVATLNDQLPYSAYYGSDMVIGEGLITNTEMGVLGNVTGIHPNETERQNIIHEEDVFVSGTYDGNEVVGGNGTVHESAQVPSIEFDVEQMVTEHRARWASGGFNRLYPKAELSDPNDSTGNTTVTLPGSVEDKGLWLRFDPSYPNHVWAATTRSARQSVANPYTNEVLVPLSFTESGEAMIVIEDFGNVAIEGTYSHSLAVVQMSGSVSIVGDLQANPSMGDLPPIGLISAGTGSPSGNEADHNGNVYVRGMRNRNDYGFAQNSKGVVNAHIYAGGIVTHFHPTGMMDTLTMNARIISANTVEKSTDKWTGIATDFHNVAHNRHLWPPTNDLIPPGMTPEFINVIGLPPRVKDGSWIIGRASFRSAD